MNLKSTNSQGVIPKLRIGCLALLLVAPLVCFTWCHFTPLNFFPAPAIAALRSDPAAIFYSIEPEPVSEDVKKGFRGYSIVGQTVLSSTDERNFIVQQLTKATRGAWDEAACFDPRHAFRASGPEGTFDILMCFQCGQAYVYYPNGREVLVHIQGSADELNDFLKRKNVPLPVQ